MSMVRYTKTEEDRSNLLALADEVHQWCQADLLHRPTKRQIKVRMVILSTAIKAAYRKPQTTPQEGETK